ncbi:ATP-binding protein [Stenotrophomonas maltophilia]|nr:ATP-binding protein [Stenotrophomonas maltophilia]
MRLKSVKLPHFRGYHATAVIPIDEALTGIVGRNDYGKSTIPEALAIFIESGDVKADKSDMNCIGLAEGAGSSRLPARLTVHLMSNENPGYVTRDENGIADFLTSAC